MHVILPCVSFVGCDNCRQVGTETVSVVCLSYRKSLAHSTKVCYNRPLKLCEGARLSEVFEQKAWYLLLFASLCVVIPAACHRHQIFQDDDIIAQSISSRDTKPEIFYQDQVCELDDETDRVETWGDANLQGLDPFFQALENPTGQALALEARRYGHRQKGKGRCLRGFRHALSRVMKVRPFFSFHKLPQDHGNPPIMWRHSPGKSADLFLRWAKENPVSLCRELGLADVTGLYGKNMQPGQVALYRRGRCGYHKQHGHIEVMVSQNEMCSDHCRLVSSKRKPCQPDMVLAPVSDCSWLLVTIFLKK